MIDKRGFNPFPAPSLIRYSLGKGSIGTFKRISEIWRSFRIPTVVAIAAGWSPRGVNKLLNDLICKIELKEI
ncbi:MAG: hypothetical protein WCJ93_07625 [Methanomicrobiales archaeon]